MVNPLDLQGPQFLGLYIVLLIAAAVVAAGLQALLRQPGGDGSGYAPGLDAYEAAYLAGGPERVADAGLLALAGRDVLFIERVSRMFRVHQPLPPMSHPVEQALFAAAPASLEQMRKVAGRAITPIRDRLREMGLVPGPAELKNLRLGGAAVVGVVLLLGLAKIAVGLSRGRPVQDLAWLCVITVGVGLYLAARSPSRRPRGDSALRALMRANQGLRATAGSGAALTPSDAALAAGLFGATALALPALAPVVAAMRPQRGSGADTAGGGGSDGGGCGGCGD